MIKALFFDFYGTIVHEYVVVIDEIATIISNTKKLQISNTKKLQNMLTIFKNIVL